MKSKIALFDLDGTLLNTNDLIIETFKYTFKKHLNKEVSLEDLIPHMGEPLFKTLVHFSESKADMMLKTYRSYNSKKHDELTTLFPYVEETLSNLREHGFKIALVTSKQTAMAVHGLKTFGLDKYFDCIVGSGDTVEHKPHPEPILKAISSIDKNYNLAFMVGDSPYDILAARAAGIIPIGVEWSLRLDELVKLKPFLILKSLQDLTKEFCMGGEFLAMEKEGT